MDNRENHRIIGWVVFAGSACLIAIASFLLNTDDTVKGTVFFLFALTSVLLPILNNRIQRNSRYVARDKPHIGYSENSFDLLNNFILGGLLGISLAVVFT